MKVEDLEHRNKRLVMRQKAIKNVKVLYRLYFMSKMRQAEYI